MAYEKQTWSKGDTITAEKLNHMEDGIAAVEKQQGPAGPAGAAGEKGDTGEQGPKGETGSPGAAGKDAPTITGCTINVTGTAISGQLTMSEGEPIAITGTYTAG